MDALRRFNPRPKPEKRGPKPRTPLRSRYSASDPADFDKEALRAIHGEHPQCFLITSQKAHDYHHVFGRGPKERRILFSSVFNAAPVWRETHDHCPFLNTDEMQSLLLQAAVNRVNLAVAKGEYDMTENDLAFLEYLRSESAPPSAPSGTGENEATS